MEGFSETLAGISAQNWLQREHPLGMAQGLVPSLMGWTRKPTSLLPPPSPHLLPAQGGGILAVPGISQEKDRASEEP